MIRWLVIALFIYLMYRLITGPRNRKRTPFFHFQAGRFPGTGNADSSRRKRSSRRNELDQIEDAEFEDITETESTDKKSGE